MGCIMVVGGRTFFESIPSNILTMILIGASLYLIGVILFMEEISVQPRYLAFFCTRSCLSLRRYYWRSRLSDYK
jgi:predicted membrane channel-forming protein YqfA (hemolysin III family)